MSDGKLMFTTKDPLGRNIQLDIKTWNVHIVPGHNELYKQDSLVKKIIEDPKFILRDKDRNTVENYVDICHLPKGDGSLSILKICIEFSSSTGDVSTAYTTKNMVSQLTTGKGVVYERP